MKKLYIIILSFIFLAACKESKPETEVSKSDQIESTIAEVSTLDEINNEILNNPESPNGYYKRAYYYKNIYDYNNAITDINRALKLTPDVPALTYLKADILFNQAGVNQNPVFYEQAEIYLLETLKMDSTHVEAQVLEARINMGKPNFEKAMANLNSALRADKYHAPAYFWKAMIFELTGEPEKAMSSYQTAIEVDANYYDALHHLGNMYAKNLDEKALVYYDAALAINPESFEVLRNKGLYLKDMDRYDEAQVCFKKIIATDDQCEECYFNLGNIYIAAYRDDMSDYSKDTTTSMALENFAKAIELNDEYIDAFYNSGLIHQHRGEKKKAIEFYQKALVLEPMHEPSLEALRNL
jgi:tetratricopeptide (TPR) repeat protein